MGSNIFHAYMQVDLVSLPPIITNRVMKRVPLSIHYLREHLLHNRPLLPSHLPLVSPPTPDKQPEFELPTSPQIPTPNVPQETYCNLSSLPMESNPLYQSSHLYTDSARLRTQTQESWQLRGAENQSGVKLTRQVSTVPEEIPEEENGAEKDVDSLSTTLVEIDLDTSHCFPAQFDMTTSNASLVKSKHSTDKEQWLLVQAPATMDHSPSRSVKSAGKERRDDNVTPDVFPGNSQGNEWTVASSNHE